MSNTEKLAQLNLKLQEASEEYLSGRSNTRKALARVKRLARQKVSLQYGRE